MVLGPIDYTIIIVYLIGTVALVAMGSMISVSALATIIGKDRLKPADTMASDLRCGFALILGAIAARDNKNVSCIHRVYHVRRSYYKIISKLKKLGINIKVIS